MDGSLLQNIVVVLLRLAAIGTPAKYVVFSAYFVVSDDPDSHKFH